MAINGRFNRKIVLDTNVILFDALAITKFKDSDIVIPFSVIEEVDRFKRDLGENGRNARHFSRFIDVLRSQGPLASGVLLEKSKSYVYVSTDIYLDGMPPELDGMKADNRILATALGLQRKNPTGQVELVTKDINLRIKADVFGINAKDYDPDETSFEEMYTGVKEIEVDPQLIDRFYREKSVAYEGEQKLHSNQYVIMKDSSNSNHSAIGRYSGQQMKIVSLISPTESIWGIHPRNVEQSFALDALLNDEVLFV
ncbi:MAG: PhoH family protein, partial [Bdellovibrionales bacterium]|nr:PhoH family protein [Bdellovibrionales bacterium]